MFVFETASFSGVLFVVVVVRVFVRCEEEKTRGSVCVVWGRSLVRLSFARGKSISYCVSVSLNE